MLVRKLALGGMAEIFLAKQAGAEGFERNVVIKRILPNLVEDDSFISMFLDEARLAARLTHPNIVVITDFGAAQDSYFLCMEYLAGEDLGTVLKALKKRAALLPVEIACRVVIDAARGLHFAHEYQDESGRPMNVIHRDVSPANLLVTFQGITKVVDFGIAKAESRASSTGIGVLKGKFRYMPPEQVQQQPVDRRLDVYALGVTLFEALTHKRVFERESDPATLNAIVEGKVPSLRDSRADLAPELEAVVLRAMAYRPDDRYATAEDFAEALEGALGPSLSQASHKRVSEYLKQVFGEAQVQLKSRIPALSTFMNGAMPDAHQPTQLEVRKSDPSLRPLFSAGAPKRAEVGPRSESSRTDTTPLRSVATAETAPRYAPVSQPLPAPPAIPSTGMTQTDKLSATQVKRAQEQASRPTEGQTVTKEASPAVVSPLPRVRRSKLPLYLLAGAAGVLGLAIVALLLLPPAGAPRAAPPVVASAPPAEPVPAVALVVEEEEPPIAEPVAGLERLGPRKSTPAESEPVTGAGAEVVPEPPVPSKAANPRLKPFSRQTAQKVIRGAKTGVFGCIGDHAAELPPGKRTISVDLFAEPDGTVSRVRTAVKGFGSLDSSPAGQCIGEQMRGLTFPESPVAAPVGVSYDYELGP